MTLNARLGADAGKFLNPNHFAEPITYTPQGELGRTINALVDRAPIKPIDHGGRSFPGNTCEIVIANDPVLGVTKVKERFDLVTFPLRLGGDPVNMRVNKVIKEGFGMWRLEVTI